MADQTATVSEAATTVGLTVTDTDAGDAITWTATSGNMAVARVSLDDTTSRTPTLTVTGVSAGTARVTLTAMDDSGQSNDEATDVTFEVTVYATPCDNPAVVSQAPEHAGLRSDCETLLAIEDTLVGDARDVTGGDTHFTLNWGAAGRVLSTDGNTPPRAVRWFGIGVGRGSLSGRVSSLSLAAGTDVSLAGTLPPELGDLPGLEGFQILGNPSLTGPIPPELGMLSRLLTLNLSDTGLTGSIPPQLGDLSSLAPGNLILLRNALTGCIPTSVAALGGFDLARISPQSGGNLAVCAAAIDDTSPRVGETLTASTNVERTGTATYQWQQGAADGTETDWANIAAGATSATFEVTAAQMGRRIRVVVVFTDASPSIYVETLTSAATAAVAAALTLDVDGNDEVEALTDGLLMLRVLLRNFEPAQVSLTNALGTGARRTTAADIVAYLQGQRSRLDVDGNDSLEALTDGLLVLRALLRNLDPAQVSLTNALGTGATRTTATDIVDYVRTLSSE